jgi:hypothetical protein
VGGVTSSDAFRLYRMNDATGDGIPDGCTLTLVFSTAPASAYVTSVARSLSGNTAYILDRRCQDICVVEDTNSDGWPDSVVSTPFALSSTFPSLLDARSITVEVHGDAVTVVARPEGPGVASPALQRGGTFVAYADTNGDGVADTETFGTSDDRLPQLDVAHGGVPFDGQTTLRTYSPEAAEGKTVQVATIDQNGDDIAVLGSAVVDAAGYSNVAMSPALAQGDSIAIRYATSPADRSVWVVRPQVPQLLRVTSGLGDPASANSVSISGLGLVAGMSVYYLTPRATDASQAVGVPFSLNSSTEVVVSLPLLAGAEDIGMMTFFATGQGQAIEDRVGQALFLFDCGEEE